MTAGRKKGQDGKNPAAKASFQLRDMDRKFWKRIKILVAMEGMSIRDLIIDALEDRLKKKGL